MSRALAGAAAKRMASDTQIARKRCSRHRLRALFGPSGSHIAPPRLLVLHCRNRQGIERVAGFESDTHHAMTSAKPKSKPRAVKSESSSELPALTHPEIRAIVLGIMLAMFLGALDQTIVATALPTIGRHFGNINDLSWVVTAICVTGTAVTPLYGNSPIFMAAAF